MSLLRTLDRTSAVSNTHTQPFLTFVYPLLERGTCKRNFTKKAIKNAPPPATHGRLDTFFVQALVRAGSCPKHAKQMSTLSVHDSHSVRQHRFGPRSTWHKPESRGFKRRAGSKGPIDKVKNFAEKELQALVDYYGMELDTRPDQDLPDAGSLVWNVGDSHEPWPLRDKADAVHIKKLEKLLEDDEAPHEEVFDTYKKLPSPGVVYLRIELIRSLLHHLAIVQRPTPIAMQRFLSMLDDMKTAHIHIIRSEWTSAMHLAGRAMGKVGSDELQSALHIWRDMERRAAIKGRDVTFNVLFNVAVKAGRYALAESFMKEMQARRLPMFRYWRVTLLYYYGVLQNGNGVRKAYQDLIAAGEIVDTVVLNAVIASLIRAGEPSAGEHVFKRMKRLHATRIAPAPGHRFLNRNWRDRRALGLLFREESRRLVREGRDDELKRLQDFAPVAPDTRTYGILIRYYAATAGNIDRVDELLREMKLNAVALDGTVFIVIFQGFNAFGGVRYSSWTSSKLEKIWTMYLKALDEQLERTWLSSLAVIAALKAFARCTEPDRTIRAWEQIRALWEPDEAELESVMVVLRGLLPPRGLEGKESRGFFDARDPW